VAGDNTRPRKTVSGGTTSEDIFSFATPVRRSSSGRIRTLAEARDTLQIPISQDAAVRRAWRPLDFLLKAFPVADETEPALVAEFAALLWLEHEHGRLTHPTPRKRRTAREITNQPWIVYGRLVQASHGALVIETLTIGPAFEEQLSHKGGGVAAGISSELLRLVSPARLLSTAVERLQRDQYQLEVAHRLGAPATQEKQLEVYRRIEQGRPRHSDVSDDQIIAITKRYITLVRMGLRHPLPQLAREFGITRDQARDRVHRARTHQYLAAGTHGRASAEPGPRFRELAWAPPSFEMTDELKDDWVRYGERVLLNLTPEEESRYQPLQCPINPAHPKRRRASARSTTTGTASRRSSMS
jgi:hypothetical protein